MTRIRRDFRAIDAVIANHFGPGDDERELSALNCDWVATEFADDIPKLLAVGAGNYGPGEEEVALAHLLSAERCLTDLLNIAEERSEVLREEVGADHVLSVFSRDLGELAEILGVPFKPCAPSEPPPARGVSTGHRGQTRESPPAWTPLDAKERARRNERVVTARLAGASVRGRGGPRNIRAAGSSNHGRPSPRPLCGGTGSAGSDHEILAGLTA